MAELIKNKSGTNSRHKLTGIPDWAVTPDAVEDGVRRRIIKAKEAAFCSDNREIPLMQVVPEGPMIKPIRDGLFVKGVEVQCRCGETHVIHFDLDEDSGPAGMPS